MHIFGQQPCFVNIASLLLGSACVPLPSCQHLIFGGAEQRCGRIPPKKKHSGSTSFNVPPVTPLSRQLQSTGRLLEEQLPEMMTELLAIARDKMLCPSESMLTRSLLLEVIELHANNWNPLTPTITQYYNKTIQKLTA